MGCTLDEILRLPLAELKERFLVRGERVPEGLLEALACDARRGARNLGQEISRRRDRRQAELRRLRRLLEYESELWKAGYGLIAGVDEAGMAPLAGPVVAGAVILPRGYRLPGLDDSKKIPDEAKRASLSERIKQDAVAWAVGWAEVDEIDRCNIYQAGLLAMRRAVEALPASPDYILVDARRIPDCTVPQRGIIRGDQASASIAAASIIAKTTRDAHLCALDREYPGYGLASHKGYPTPEHLAAIRRYGVLPIHRRSFRPVREALEGCVTQPSLFDQAVEAE